MEDVGHENVNAGSGARIVRGRRGMAPETKVAVAIYALLALLTVSVLVAVVMIVGVKKNSTQLVDEQVEYATAIDEAALHAKGMANDERGFLISGRGEFLDQRVGRTRKARAAFDVALSQATGAAERDAVAQARIGFERWVAALEVEIARFQAGDRSGAVTASLGRTRALRKAYESSLAAASARAEVGIEAARNSVTATSSRSVTILLVYLVLALAVGFCIALWIVSTGPATHR
jgi:methyl-accepting chemotaxis protein